MGTSVAYELNIGADMSDFKRKNAEKKFFFSLDTDLAML
jgi:hypothetical protein